MQDSDGAGNRIAIGTIGHSTHPIGEFIGILKTHSIEQLIDIRTVPRSRKNPQFNRDTLPVSLQAEGIVYEHMPGLGGLRRPRPDSINKAWRNASFRGYADYMQTPEFTASVDRLIALAQTQATVIMCAEAVQWRCHRSLVADALVARGIAVQHIHSATRAQPHRLTPFSRLDGTRIIYPEDGTQMDLPRD